MSMTVVVTRNVRPRIRGLLASTMLELAPGVYSSPSQSPAVRNRIWNTLEEWFVLENDASIIMLWYEPEMPGRQATRVLGLPPIDLVPVDGLVLARRQVDEEEATEAWERTNLGKRGPGETG